MEKTVVAAPWLFPFECQAVLRRKVSFKELTPTEGSRLWGALWNIGIELRHAEGLWELAWRLAERHARPTTYDSCYWALAELLDAELWTADHRFARSVGAHPRIKTPPSG